MEHLLTLDSLISFLVLVILEIILGIDNVIFVTLIINRLPENEHKRARRYWMIFGIIVRSGLLLALSWLLNQKGKSLFTVFGKGFDLASLVMIAGGLFLIWKTVGEIHEKLEDHEGHSKGNKATRLSFPRAVVQIVLIDMVFSFDSVITAGGTAKLVEVMIAAVIVAMIAMFLFSPKIASFIHHHPTIKILALSFLVMIGLVLIIEGWSGQAAEELHLKNYVYFAMAFSFGVELLNLRVRRNLDKTGKSRK